MTTMVWQTVFILNTLAKIESGVIPIAMPECMHYVKDELTLNIPKYVDSWSFVHFGQGRL